MEFRAGENGTIFGPQAAFCLSPSCFLQTLYLHYLRVRRELSSSGCFGTFPAGPQLIKHHHLLFHRLKIVLLHPLPHFIDVGIATSIHKGRASVSCGMQRRGKSTFSSAFYHLGIPNESTPVVSLRAHLHRHHQSRFDPSHSCGCLR